MYSTCIKKTRTIYLQAQAGPWIPNTNLCMQLCMLAWHKRRHSQKTQSHARNLYNAAGEHKKSPHDVPSTLLLMLPTCKHVWLSICLAFFGLLPMLSILSLFSSDNITDAHSATLLMSQKETRSSSFLPFLSFPFL